MAKANANPKDNVLRQRRSAPRGQDENGVSQVCRNSQALRT
jgi:hypothetical protein